jgi:hypothetical protein
MVEQDSFINRGEEPERVKALIEARCAPRVLDVEEPRGVGKMDSPREVHGWYVPGEDRQSERVPCWLAFLAYLAYLRAMRPPRSPGTVALLWLITIVGLVLAVLALVSAGAPEVVEGVVKHWPAP